MADNSDYQLAVDFTRRDADHQLVYKKKVETAKLIKSAKILLGINIIFWTVMAVYFLFTDNYWLIKIFLLLEPILFAVIWLGLTKKIKLIYILSLLFILINVILSLTDETGLYDLISLILNLLILINLLLLWQYVFNYKNEII